MFETAKRKMWMLHFRRDEPSAHCGYWPIPFFGLPADDEIKSALLSRFYAPKRGCRPPTIAELRNGLDEIVMRARIHASDRVEIEMRPAS